MRSLSQIYENSFIRERIKANNSQTSCKSLEHSVTTDSKSFQRLHLFSPRVTLIPHKLDASLLFNHQNFASEMTNLGREEIRNEIHVKTENLFCGSLSWHPPFETRQAERCSRNSHSGAKCWFLPFSFLWPTQKSLFQESVAPL